MADDVSLIEMHERNPVDTSDDFHGFDEARHAAGR
jgi:hypothetical protein